MKKILNIITLFILISNNFFAQEDKTVELTTTGTGKTKEIAIHIALRSAIEQAFGVFISSKTEVLNDELLTDQIISVSNGNIQQYDIISEMPIDDNTSFAVTVKSKVSISKLTSFIESKGIEVEFKGAVFAMNIKQQKLNEESELKAIKEMAAILKNIADRSFDFEVAANGEPTSRGKDDWNIPLIIKIKLNKNFENYKSYFQKTLSALTMTEAEANNYISLKKPIYSIMLRNSKKPFDTILTNNFKNQLEAYYSNPLNHIRVIRNPYYKENKIAYNEYIKSFGKVLEGKTEAEKNKFITELNQALNNGTYPFKNSKPVFFNQDEFKKINMGFNFIFRSYKRENYFGDSNRVTIISESLYDKCYLRNENSIIEIQKSVFDLTNSQENFILEDGISNRSKASLVCKAYYLQNNFCPVFINSQRDGWSLDTNSNYYSLITGEKYNKRSDFYSYSYYPSRTLYNYIEVIKKFGCYGDRISFKNERRKGFDIRYHFEENYIKFNFLFPAVEMNLNDLTEKSDLNFVLQFNCLTDKNNVVSTIEFKDVKSLNDINKLKGYKIYPKK